MIKVRPSTARPVVIAALAVLALAGFATTSAFAGERIKFKNGHRLVVESVREEGETVFVKLADGSEVGFPASLIEEVEGGHQARAQGRRTTGSSPIAPSFEKLNGYKQAMRETGMAQDIRVNTKGLKLPAGKALSVGYTRAGSVDVSSLGDGSRSAPQVSLTDHMRERRALAAAPEAPAEPGAKPNSAASALTPRVVSRPGQKTPK